jgi:hypothetical protein
MAEGCPCAGWLTSPRSYETTWRRPSPWPLPTLGFVERPARWVLRVGTPTCLISQERAVSGSANGAPLTRVVQRPMLSPTRSCR